MIILVVYSLCLGGNFSSPWISGAGEVGDLAHAKSSQLETPMTRSSFSTSFPVAIARNLVLRNSSLQVDFHEHRMHFLVDMVLFASKSLVEQRHPAVAAYMKHKGYTLPQQGSTRNVAIQ
jgi:hypothetical protein